MTPTLAVRDWILMLRGSCELTLRLCDMRTYTLIKFGFLALDHEDTIRDWGCKALASLGSIVRQECSQESYRRSFWKCAVPEGTRLISALYPGLTPGAKTNAALRARICANQTFSATSILTNH